MPRTPQETALACAMAMQEADNAARTLGLEVVEVGPGRARLRMMVTGAMTNCHGTCHGGFIFALADAAFGYACNAHGQRSVAQQAAVSFLQPALEGETLQAEAREVWRRGRGGLYDVTVTNPAGETVAELRGHARTIAGSVLPGPG